TTNAQQCAILEFRGARSVSEADVDGISEMFMTYFHPVGYIMVERAQIDKVISEQGFQSSSLTEAQMVKLGEILNVSKVVVGTVSMLGGEYQVDVRVVDVELGHDIAAEGASFNGNYRTNVSNLATRLANKLALATPLSPQESYAKGKKEYDAENYAEAVQWFQKAAEQGHAEAQYALGLCYYRGEGVQKNYAEAVQWFQKAAEQGHADAQRALGVCYYNGEGVQKNDAEAVKWFQKVAEQGHADAQYNLGLCYYRGYGMQQNYAEAVKWFRKAAEQGNADAQCALGVCYAKGNGVPQNYEEAVKWYRKAAEQGYATAQYNLGWCYERGNGVGENSTEAAKWLRKAAEQGDADAQKALNELGY
ncbi:MAG: SEL1-like repeat protein, partial [Prevotellaceae bacterium]|nr:SEL1-like repeat protein [Prevotellaceae bacterium]